MTPHLRHDEEERIIYEGPDAPAAFLRAKDALLQFRFYAPRVVADIPGGRIQQGLEFVQHIRVGPLRLRGPVRVVRVWDEQGITFRSAGFTYEALPGHVERGIASFAVLLRGNEIRLRIASDSAPATWFVRLGAPLARRMQRKARRTAFNRMRVLAAAATT